MKFKTNNSNYNNNRVILNSFTHHFYFFGVRESPISGPHIMNLKTPLNPKTKTTVIWFFSS